MKIYDIFSVHSCFHNLKEKKKIRPESNIIKFSIENGKNDKYYSINIFSA